MFKASELVFKAFEHIFKGYERISSKYKKKREGGHKFMTHPLFLFMRF